MAIDAYMYFQGYDNKFLKSESQIDGSSINDSDTNWKKFKFSDAWAGGKDDNGLFEIEDFSFDVEQALNIGSQSTGTGAGRITFNPFSITRKIDRSSPEFFNKACSGTPFKSVVLGARKAGGGKASGSIYLVFTFKLVAVKTISWSYDDEAPKETITFEYGGLFIQYNQQKPDGTINSTPNAYGWNRVKNVTDPDWATAIT